MSEKDRPGVSVIPVVVQKDFYWRKAWHEPGDSLLLPRRTARLLLAERYVREHVRAVEPVEPVRYVRCSVVRECDGGRFSVY